MKSGMHLLEMKMPERVSDLITVGDLMRELDKCPRDAHVVPLYGLDIPKIVFCVADTNGHFYIHNIMEVDGVHPSQFK